MLREKGRIPGGVKGNLSAFLQCFPERICRSVFLLRLVGVTFLSPVFGQSHFDVIRYGSLRLSCFLDEAAFEVGGHSKV